MASIKFSSICITVSLIVTLFLFSAILSLIAIINLHDFLRSLSTKEMIFSLRLTTYTATISTILSILVGVLAAYAIARKDFPGKNLVKTILDIPMAMPEIVLGLVLLLLLGHSPLAELLRKVGISVVFTQLGIIVAQFFSSLPYSLRILSSSFESLNPRYEFVSRSLGYSEFETFLKITLPLSRSGIIAALAVAFARSIGTFGAILILAGGIYMQTETLPVTLYLNISYGNLSMAMSAGLLLIIVSFITIFIIEKSGAGKIGIYGAGKVIS